MKLSIIIVSWNVKELLNACLISIFRYLKDFEYEVIVVDNDSNDGTLDMIKTNYPQVNLLANKKNIGFGAANNLAMKMAKGEYILFLNDDTKFINSNFSKLFNYFEEDNKLGMLGCKLLNPDKSIQKSVRRFPTLLDQIVIMTKLHNFFPKLISKYLWENFDYNKKQEVDQVMGSFMLTKNEILGKVGSFDKRFFLWFEEVDLEKRIKKAGYKILYTPEFEIVHHKESSFIQLNRLKAQLNFNKSLLKYFIKHHSIFSLLILIILQPLSFCLALIVQLFKIK